VSQPVPVGIIGCGGIAQVHLEAMKRVPALRAAVFFDTGIEAAKKTAERFGGQVVAEADELFNRPEVQAVLICTPPVTHAALMKKAIAAGKHVLCEKPFTVYTKEAEDVRKAAAGSKSLVMMSSKYRFVPDVTEARRKILEGAVGDIVMAEVIFCAYVGMEGHWKSDAAWSGGGVLIDNGCHAVDLIRYLVGPVRSVYAQAGKKTQKIEVEDTARLHFEAGDGVIGMVDLSWSLFKHQPNYVNIFGTLGTIEVGWQESAVWNSSDKTSVPIGGGYQKLDAFTRQLEHFAECMAGKASPLMNTDDAVESVRVIETAYASIRGQQWLKI
jgi:predicted dehydrogenase